MFRTALVLAALIASTSAQAGLFVDHWVPTARTCPSDTGALALAIKDASRICRASSTFVDAVGSKRVDGTAYRTCMEEDGWTKSRKAEKKTWLTQCESALPTTRIATR